MVHLLHFKLEEIRERSMAEGFLVNGSILVGVCVFSMDRLECASELTKYLALLEDLVLPQRGWWELKSPPIMIVSEWNGHLNNCNMFAFCGLYTE